jgi:hypothetical protein
MDDKPLLPNIPSLDGIQDQATRKALEALKEIIEVGVGTRPRSDVVDSFVTYRDLYNSGIANLNINGSILKNNNPSSSIISPTGDADLSIPPTPTGFKATGMSNSVFLEWDDPPYSNHAYTEIWRADTNNIGVAVLRTNAPGFIAIDPVALTNATFYYWIRFVNRSSVEGPFNSLNGTSATTDVDVNQLLDLLDGQLSESALIQSLRDRIDLIDDAGVITESVTHRIGVEEQNRVAAILVEADARASAILAEASARGTAISSESTSRQNADNALSQQITTLTATVSSNTSAIQSEATTRASADSAEATARNVLVAQVNHPTTGLAAAHSAIQSETTARASADSAIATQINTLQASVNGNSSAITAEQTARSNADTALAQQITTLTSTVNSNTSLIQSESTTRASDDTALANQITTLQTTVNGNTSSIQSEATTRANADSTNATAINTLTSQFNSTTTTLNAAIQAEATTRANADSAEASARSTLAAQVNNTTTGLPAAHAAIQSEATTRASADSSLATQINTVQASSNGNTAAIQAESTARIASDNSLFAQYTVKIDVNGYVSGFGLASTANNATPYSEFAIVADKFTIAPVATSHSAADGSPFFYLTTPTVINGVTVPAGAYMKGAYIAEATIDTLHVRTGAIKEAQIDNLAVSDAKILNILASKIRSGTLLATEYIAVGTGTYKVIIDGLGNIRIGATGYSAGNGIWFGEDNGAAKVSFGNGSSSYIRFNGNTIEIKTTNFTVDAAGNATFSGGGTFSGALNAATGTFVGAMTAGSININNVFKVDSSGNVAQGMTAFATGHGAWYGLIGGYIKYSVGYGISGVMSKGFSYDEQADQFNFYGQVIATGNILNDAITSGASVYTAAAQNLNSGWNGIQILATTIVGNKSMVLASAGLYINGSASGAGGIDARFIRDGVVLQTYVSVAEVNGGGRQQTSPFVIQYMETEVGSHTYQIEARQTGFATGSPQAHSRAISIVDFKK